MCRGRENFAALQGIFRGHFFLLLSVVFCDGNWKGETEKPGGFELRSISADSPSIQGTESIGAEERDPVERDLVLQDEARTLNLISALLSDYA